MRPGKAGALLRNVALAFAMLLTIAPASAQETITYKYDGRGRLVTVDHGSTGPNAGIKSNYAYDHADNRCNVTVGTSGASGTCAGGTGGGGTTTLTLSPASLPAGVVGIAYTKTITASGGTSPYTFAVTSGALPTGLTLTSGGSLSGTPSATGTYHFTVTASDGPGDSGSRAYNVTVGVALNVNPTGLAAGTVGTPYNQTFTATGGTSPYTFTKSGTVPPGLTLTSAGLLSGTPSTTGSYSFTVFASDTAGDSGSRAYNLSITASAPCSGVTFAVSDATSTAGFLQFSVSKGGTTSNSCSVSYATEDADATAPTDYTATSGTLTFGPTDSSEPISVLTHNSALTVDSLTMLLNLSNPTGGATITTAQGVGTIIKAGVCPLQQTTSGGTGSSTSSTTQSSSTENSVQPMQPICP
jgi:hypothetical protein